MTRALAAGCGRAVVLVVAGTGLGLGWNALRTADRIELGRRYFKDVEPPPRARGGGEGAVAGSPPTVDGFAVVTTDEVAALLAGAEWSSLVLVDARDAEHYAAGHLPGAVKVDYYNAHVDLQQSLARIAVAGKVVVYCSSDECDDALLLCRELRDTYGVAAEKLVVYRDGMRAWEQRGMRVERER